MNLGGRHSIHEVIGEVTRAVVPAITENEIQRRVCEEFAASELYSYAWIGRDNPEKEGVIPAASAGIAEMAGDEITGESPLQEPANEAVRTGRVTVKQNLVDDPPREEWRDHARKHDYQTCAFVPLVHEETQYGVLYLATNRSQGIGTVERESLGELGVTIAYAVETAESSENTDSTEPTKAETELTGPTAEPDQERRLYETIVSSTPDLIYAFDLDYRFIFANDALLEMWGQTLEESMGKTMREIGYEPWHAEMHEREIDQVVETKEPVRGEVAFDHAELGRRIYDYIFAPVLNDEGEVEAIAGTTRDVTERKEAEKALQKSEERFRALVTASSDVVYRMSPDWSEMQHLEGKEFIPDTHESTSDWLDKYIHPDDQERVTEAIDEAIRTKSTFELEHQVKRVDGSLGWTFSRAVPMLDDDGDIVEWIGMARDITERKERERELDETITELQESEERLQLALEAGGMGTWELDPQTGDAPVRSPQHDRIFGYEDPLDDWNFETFLEHVHPDDREHVQQTFEGASETGTWEFESRIIRADGEQRVISAKGELYYDDEGDPVRAVGVVQDVTERWETQRSLEESERRYRTLVENFPSGSVGLFNEDLEYTAIGGELLDRLDMDPEDRIGHSIRELHPPDYLSEIEPYFQAALEGETNSFEVEFSGRYLHLTTLPVRDADDEVFAGMVVVQDVTERREYERRLEESNERLEQFAYAASHDLQEPLRMVSSYLSLIERRYADELDEDGEEFIEFAIDGADRMREMIEGLLEYSRVETRGDPFAPTNLNTVLEDVRDNLQVKIDETDADLTIEELPRVEGDANQLRQVFQNLLENAIEYSGDEPPRIRVTAERDGPEWVLSVRDAGIGIDPGHADSIFQVFERLHTNDEHEGTGIGLALCERIVERHGGDIWVDSEPGEGSTFSFTLPASDT